MTSTAAAQFTLPVLAEVPAGVDLTDKVIKVDFEALLVPTTDNEKAIAALGKAKDGAITLKDLTDSRSDVFMVNLNDLYEYPGFNSREKEDPRYQDSLVSIAHEIAAAGGVLEPMKVWLEEGKLYIANGNRRYWGSKLANRYLGANVTNVPVMKGPRGEKHVDRLALQVQVNGNSLGLTLYEQGNLFIQMGKEGLSVAAIAAKLGRSKTHVDNALKLHEAPTEVRTMLKTGKISAELALKGIRGGKGSGKATVEYLSKAVSTSIASGKKKATVKHAPKSADRVNVVAEMSRLFAALQPVVHKDTDEVELRLSATEYKLMKKWLRIG